MSQGEKGDKGDKGEPGEDAPLVELVDLLRAERWRWRGWFALLALVVGVLGFLVVEAAQARQENCRLVADSLDYFTDALVAATDDPTLTPEERAKREQREAAFRSDFHSRLAECE